MENLFEDNKTNRWVGFFISCLVIGSFIGLNVDHIFKICLKVLS